MSDRPDPLLRALVQALAPRFVVEIAAAGTSQARGIADAAPADLQELHLVGGADEALLQELRARYGDRVRAHDGLTLNVVASLSTAPDLVIVGGDPNWYTVFNVLRLLARASGAQPYPVVLVRDTGWPYGRRDAYPTPHAIPGAYQSPHARSGVRPEKAELDHAGLFSDTNHSLFENTEKNGVRTAVDDFVESSGLPLDHVFVAGLHGVSMLVDRRRADVNPQLSSLMSELIPSASISARLDAIESARLGTELALSAERAKSERRGAERSDVVARLAELRATLDRTERELAVALAAAHEEKLRVAEMESGRTTLEALVTTVESELREARSRIAELTFANQQMETAQARSAERERAEAETAASHRRNDEPRRERAPTGSERPPVPARKREKPPSSSRRNGPAESPFTRALAGAVPVVVSPAALELASRRLAKLRRDPKLFLAHSRFELARKLARML